MTGYKLTTINLTTYGGTPWVVGVEQSAAGEGPLCTSGWIYVYDSAECAEIMDPRHARFGATGLLWRVEWAGRTMTDGLSRGVERCTILERVERVELTLEERVWCAVLAAGEEETLPAWRAWAGGWLRGEDRSRSAAVDAAAALQRRSPDWSAAWSATWSAAAAVAPAWSVVPATRQADAVAAAAVWAADAAARVASAPLDIRAAESCAAEAVEEVMDAARTARAMPLDIRALVSRARARTLPDWAVAS